MSAVERTKTANDMIKEEVKYNLTTVYQVGHEDNLLTEIKNENSK